MLINVRIMKRNIVKILLISLCTVVSCTPKEELSSVQKDGSHLFEIEAVLAVVDDEDTKASAASYTMPKWVEGDKISVVNLTTKKVLGGQLTTTKSGVSAPFSGNLKGLVTEGDCLAFIYPPMDNAEQKDFSKLSFDLSSQDGKEVRLFAYSKISAPSSSAEFTNLTLTFTYMMSYMKVNMANLPASSSVTSFKIAGVPDVLSVDINSSKDDFSVESSSGKGYILIDGSGHKISPAGTYSIKFAVLPAESSSSRTLKVLIGTTEYTADFTSVSFGMNKYINTIVSRFVESEFYTKADYGVYTTSGEAVYQYSQYRDQICMGIENDKYDFTLVNPVDKSFVKVSDIPSGIDDKVCFTPTISSLGVGDIEFPKGAVGAVIKSEKDGDYTKYWVVCGDYVFVIKK